MKKFTGTMLLVVTIMCTLLFGIATVVLGFRIIQLLISGAINPTLCLEFLASAVLLGACMALAKVFGDMCDVDVKLTSDTVVGQHEGDDGDE